MGNAVEISFKIVMSKDMLSGDASDEELESAFKAAYEDAFADFGSACAESVEAFYRFQEYPGSCRTEDGMYFAVMSTGGMRRGVSCPGAAYFAKRHGCVVECAARSEMSFGLWDREVCGPDGETWFNDEQKYVDKTFSEIDKPDLMERPTIRELMAENMPVYLIKRAAKLGK